MSPWRQEYLGTNRLEEEHRQRFQRQGLEHFEDEERWMLRGCYHQFLPQSQRFPDVFTPNSRKALMSLMSLLDFPGSWMIYPWFSIGNLEFSMAPQAAHFSNALGCEAALVTCDQQLVLLRRSSTFPRNLGSSWGMGPWWPLAVDVTGYILDITGRYSG